MLILKSNNPELYHIILKPLGMSHGFYLLLTLYSHFTKSKHGWSLGIILAASLIPFGLSIEKNTVNMFKSAAEYIYFCILFKK
jgi:hypothetical protein